MAVTGIIGRKVGMTQVFEADGTVVPATVIKAGPCVVVQAKSAATDGYEAVQLGLVDAKPTKENKPSVGHFKKGIPPVEFGGGAVADPREGHAAVHRGVVLADDICCVCD